MSFRRLFAAVVACNAVGTVLANDNKHDHHPADLFSSKATFVIGVTVGSLAICCLVVCCICIFKSKMVLPGIPFKSGSVADNDNSSQQPVGFQNLPRLGHK